MSFDEYRNRVREQVKAAYENPVEVLPDEIDGDLRFFATCGQQHEYFDDSIVRLIESFARTPRFLGFDVQNDIFFDKPSVEIKQVFCFAASGDPDKVEMAADVEFVGYNTTIPENREKFDLPKTVDGYLDKPIFQVVSAMHHFSRIESSNGKAIEPKLIPVPVLERKIPSLG